VTPVHTLRTGGIAIQDATNLAVDCEAKFIKASTSDGFENLQISSPTEFYWGNVIPSDERSCSDVAKQFSKALCMANKRKYSLDVGVV